MKFGLHQPLRYLKLAGMVACLVFFAACAQVALISATPVVAAIARHMDQRTANTIAELDQKEDWAGMLGLAQAQLQRDPANSDWWLLQGYALARQGQHAAAIDSYQRALRISPEDEPIWLAMGQSQFELGHSQDAIKTYQQALRYRPESAPTYLALAGLYLRLGQPDRALPNLRESVRYDPAVPQAWEGLATAYQLTGQTERRDKALQGLRKLNAAAADRLEKQFQSK